MDESYRSLSVRLYGVMENVGASEKMRQLHQSTAINKEIAETVRHHMNDLNMSTYIFGSYMEGTTTPGLHSDIDRLMYSDRTPVHENITGASNGVSFLMVLDGHTQPGYVKLQVLLDGVPQTVYNFDIYNQVDSDCDGRICFKHFISGITDERNGPADTFLNDTLPSDYVIAFRCSSIPRFTDEWRNRKRDFNWPSRHVLDCMTSSECFVVGVGHPASIEKHIEWRLSFSLQERDMMLSFNPTQHKCYILLKMVKNDIIGRRIGKCISSYHMKTCMFYTIQNTRLGIWIPANLFLCLSLSLNVLLKWVRCGNCPNYFIKEENMFNRDIHRQVKQPLSYLLERLIQAGPKILLCIDCDNINQYLVHPECLSASKAAVEKHRYTRCVESYCFEMCFRRSLLKCFVKNKDGISTCLFLNKLLRFVQNAFLSNRKPEHYCRQTLSRLETYIQSKLGCSYVSLALDVEDPNIKSCLLNMATARFKQGRYCDITSSRLMYASVLYTTGQYDICVRLLEEIDAELGQHVLSLCSCYNVSYKGDPTLLPSSHVNTASCVVFLPSNRIIIPTPLLPELYRSVDTPPGSRDEEKDFWFDCAAVDGKVYLHFLKYLAYTKLDQYVHKQVAFDNMKWLIERESNLGHRETAYNLLALINIQEGSIREGVRCFVESWKIRPTHNAAKWHIRSLAWRLANAGVYN